MMAKSESLIRCFICLNVPWEWKVALGEMTVPLKKLKSRVSWAGSFHVTLKFLGEIPPSVLEKTRQVLEETAPQFPSFPMSLGKPGCFPGSRSPRVLWVDVTPQANILIDLQAILDKKLGQIGFAREKRRFTPHLTLGRVRSLEASDRLWERLRSLTRPQVPPFQVKSVELMQSELERQGARYSILNSYDLAPLNLC